jgi:hypothetical protein
VLVRLDHDDALKWQDVAASVPKSPRNRNAGFIDRLGFFMAGAETAA